LDSALGFPQASLWRSEIRLAWGQATFSCVSVLFLASALEMEWAKFSSVLLRQLAMEWVWISWLAASDVFAWESALVLL